MPPAILMVQAKIANQAGGYRQVTNSGIMDDRLNKGLFRVRHFPPVVHPRHAREVLAAPDDAILADWVGGYAVTTSEHRQLLEDLLASLAWRQTGNAWLIHGLYGTGKSHLLVLLHLLSALPQSWDAFLSTHPLFRRYQHAIQQRRLLVVHFSLDEYAPRHSLEDALADAVTRALPDQFQADTLSWHHATSRLDTWHALLERIQSLGFAGIVLLIDELSLFLGGKSPARREADAAFLQFLAEMTGRYPVWAVGAMQRSLTDTGPLRTHSWRQVEDRFLRRTLPVQEIGNLLRDKLIERLDLPAIRAAVTTSLAPATSTLGLPYTAGDLQMHWPFHPEAISLLLAVINNHLSPHRSLVEVLQQLATPGWIDRTADELITSLDLFSLVRDDLQRDERLSPVWASVAVLETLTADAPDPVLADNCLRLLVLHSLAGCQLRVRHLRELLFNGSTTPSIDDISTNLHYLRRHHAHLSAVRDSQPGEEVFALAIGDDIGAAAFASMGEIHQSLLPTDTRVIETVLEGCRDPRWPFSALLTGMLLQVSWCGQRMVQTIMQPAVTGEDLIRLYEGLLAGQYDGCCWLRWPGEASTSAGWQDITARTASPHADVFLQWCPRAATASEESLWREYTCWQLAAASDETTSARHRAISRRCRERAEELRPAVIASITALYTEGEWLSAGGAHGQPAADADMTGVVSDMLTAGFGGLFPVAALVSVAGVPSPVVCKQLLHNFFVPGEASPSSSSLVLDYLEQYVVPLGAVEMDGQSARVAPPLREVVERLQDAVAAGPLRLNEALSRMRKPPLGFTQEQGLLAIAACLHCGLVQGLDGFLQPLGPEATSLLLTNAVVFIGTRPQINNAYQPCLDGLAATLNITGDSWPFVCNLIERYLQDWLSDWAATIAAATEMRTSWTALFHVYPWSWKHTDRLLVQLANALAGPRTLEGILDAFGRDADFLHHADALARASAWWHSHHRPLTLMQRCPLPPSIAPAYESLAGTLRTGEDTFPSLLDLGTQLDRLQESYRTQYGAWHESVFGTAVVNALRTVFESEEFRAIKQLSRLPLPLSSSASNCLDALAQARTHYCPGMFEALETEGCCQRCRLPLGSPSPMPVADDIALLARQGLSDYAAQLAGHPWADEIRGQLGRAPDDIADLGFAFFAWRPADGAASLLYVLDERLIAWLCRDRRHAGIRQVTSLADFLQGKDLTLEEARSSVDRWLDPDGSLSGESVLEFE